MRKPVRRQPDPVLAECNAPDAAVIDEPCMHGDVLVQYCEVLSQDLQPGIVGLFQLVVSMN